MRYLKTYKLFESKYDEELLDIFNNIMINTKISSFEFHRGTDNTVHVVWGERIEFDDHQLLKNLYDYREIFKKMYNMDYFYVYMDEGLVIIVLYDFMQKWGESYLPHVRIERSKLPNVPPHIFNILDKQQGSWSNHTPALRRGIRKTNGDSSNLALFDWIYKEKAVTEKMSHDEVNDLLDYLDDIFADLKDQGYKLDYGGTLLNLSIVKPKTDNELFNSYQRYKVSDVHSTILTMDRYIRSYGLIPVSIYVEDGLSVSRHNTHCHFDLSRYNIDDVLTNFNMVMEVKIEYKEE